MDSLTPALLNGVGVVGMLAGLFWMLATGRLVTRRESDGIKEERDYWRTACIKSQDAHATEQETTRVVRDFFDKLSRGADL